MEIKTSYKSNLYSKKKETHEIPMMNPMMNYQKPRGNKDFPSVNSKNNNKVVYISQKKRGKPTKLIKRNGDQKLSN